MANKPWPPGIDPSGAGLRIRIWGKGGKLIYQETIPGDLGKGHLASAIKRRQELMARRRAGLPLSEDDTSATDQKFLEAAQGYLKTLDVRNTTSIEYERVLNRYWVPAFHNRLMTSIRENEVLERLAEFKIGGKTKRNALGVLNSVYRHAGIDSPASKIRPKKQQKPPIQRYKPEERAKLLKYLEGDAKVFYGLQFGCGLRPGEALAARFDRFDGEYLVVDQEIVRRELVATTKTAKHRRVYVPTWLRPWIQGMPSRFNTAGFLFLNQLGEWRKNTNFFDKRWKLAHERARIAYRHPYVCRHTRAAELLSIGVEPAKAAAQLGHSVQMFLNIYSEFIDEFSKQDDSIFEGVGISQKPATVK
jgi:integrase